MYSYTVLNMNISLVEISNKNGLKDYRRKETKRKK